MLCSPERERLPRRAGRARGGAALDAFVTKTVTPGAARGQPAGADRRDRRGMLNSIGLANPGRERFLAETLPRCAGSACRSGSRSAASAREYAETCAALEDVDDRAEPLLPERRRGARVGGRDRRRLPARPPAAALREALAGRLGHRRGRPGGRGRRRRRALAREHDPRPRARRRTLPGPRSRAGSGLSGPALKPIALAAVYACRRRRSCRSSAWAASRPGASLE